MVAAHDVGVAGFHAGPSSSVVERVGVFGEYYDKSKGKIIIVEKVWAVMVERRYRGPSTALPLRSG